MYEELMMRLRTEANEWCSICCYKQGDCICAAPDDRKKDCDIYSKLQAANSIEELSKLADAIPHVCECCVGCELEKKNGGCDNAFVLSLKRAMIYLSKLRWIPVTEKLPEKYHQVLVCGKNGFQIDYYAGEKSINGNPLFMISEAKVTHWMSLPTPPKEET